ncbi:hypothetical protein NIES4101_53120 [Calothrix sp. NIES-4101]|nr:hypothetical protein NIES4101_53120 [Calothrix sp. NIES-4101]
MLNSELDPIFTPAIFDFINSVAQVLLIPNLKSNYANTLS